MRQIFLDTETTGLDWRTGDRIVEIGCVEMIDRRLTGRVFHVYLNPEREVGDSERIHGLSDEFLAEKPLYASVASDFEAFVADAELIIHNASFDVGFLNMEQGRLKRPLVGELAESVLDTVKLAKEMFPGKKASLDALCERYAISNAHRVLHGALLDAQLLAEVYLAMTRGQESLIDVFEQPLDLGGEQALARAERKPLRVLRASPEELAAHESVLDGIAAKGPCVWRPAVQA